MIECFLGTAAYIVMHLTGPNPQSHNSLLSAVKRLKEKKQVHILTRSLSPPSAKTCVCLLSIDKPEVISYLYFC